MLRILHQASGRVVRPYMVNKPMVRRMHTHEPSSRLEDIYYGFLIISPIIGGGIGLVGGTYEGLKDMKHKSKYDAMVTPLVYGVTGTLAGTFIGAAFGFTAPVSIPLLGLGVILNIDKT